MPDAFIDELTPIANYMAREMNNNPDSELGRQLKRLNSDATVTECLSEYTNAPWWRQAIGTQPRDCMNIGLNEKFMALILWKNKVGTGCHWDHKPKIIGRSDFWSRSTGSAEWHVYGDTAYNHDCWSNIHYGYVGRAVGFDESVLLDGAGVAQFVSDLRQGAQWPKGTGPWLLPRRWDRPEDRITIALGMKLHRQMPVGVTAAVLVQAITTTSGLLKKKPDDVRNDVARASGKPPRAW
jgi:hypothetical protein